MPERHTETRVDEQREGGVMGMEYASECWEAIRELGCCLGRQKGTRDREGWVLDRRESNGWVEVGHMGITRTGEMLSDCTAQRWEDARGITKGRVLGTRWMHSCTDVDRT